MSDKTRFNIPPGESFDNVPPSKKVVTEYIDPPSKPDVYEMIERARLDYSKPVPKPPNVLTVNGISWGTMGDFSYIYGKAKTKKTFCTSIAVSASVGGKWGMFEGKLPEDKRKVVLFDTEQSDYHVFNVANRVTRMIGHKGIHENLDVLKLRGHSVMECRAIISAYLEMTPNVGLAVIDGIRELVVDINSQEEATDVVGLLMNWTQKSGCHIICVLHENKNNSNPRGALGTEVLNKCCTAINITLDKKNPKISLVDVQDSRDMPFEPFAFTVNEKVLPEVLHDWKPGREVEGKKRRTPGADELDPFQVYELLSALKRHAGDTKPKLSELRDLMGVAFREKIGKDLPTSHQSSYVTYFKSTNNLVLQGHANSRHSWYEVVVPESPAKGKDPDPQTHLGLSISLHDQEPF